MRENRIQITEHYSTKDNAVFTGKEHHGTNATNQVNVQTHWLLISHILTGCSYTFSSDRRFEVLTVRHLHLHHATVIYLSIKQCLSWEAHYFSFFNQLFLKRSRLLFFNWMLSPHKSKSVCVSCCRKPLITAVYSKWEPLTMFTTQKMFLVLESEKKSDKSAAN